MLRADCSLLALKPAYLSASFPRGFHREVSSTFHDSWQVRSAMTQMVIWLNVRQNQTHGSIFGSMFDQARTSVARAAQEAEGARERMEIRTASFPLKNDLLL